MVKFFNKLSSFTMHVLLFSISAVAAVMFISIIGAGVGLDFIVVATNPLTLAIAAMFALAVLVDAYYKG